MIGVHKAKAEKPPILYVYKPIMFNIRHWSKAKSWNTKTTKAKALLKRHSYADDQRVFT